jgi:hypothetical protein
MHARLEPRKPSRSAHAHITRASALHIAPPRRQDLRPHTNRSRTGRHVWNLRGIPPPPAVGPFLTIETLHGGTLPSVFAVMHMESPFATRGRDTIVGSDSRHVGGVRRRRRLVGPGTVATRQILWKKDTLEHLQLAGAKEEATAPGSGGRWRVRLCAWRVRSSKAGSLRTGQCMPSPVAADHK